jgi:hypothetical protein
MIATSLRTCCAALVFLASTATAVRAGPVYDAAADFSFTSNPNGVWSYGYETTLGGAFNAYSLTTVVNTIDFWHLNGPNQTPNVGYNPNPGSVTFASTTFLPGQVTAHPGSNHELSVIRFTAPNSGFYQLTSDFNMRSWGGTTSTDVHVLLNNAGLFNSTVTGFGSVAAFNVPFLSLNAGDRVDFVVGDNGNYLGDTTQLRARLEAVQAPTGMPAPEPLALLGFGLLGLMALRARGALPGY